jgi:glutathione peroxidase-family protein
LPHLETLYQKYADQGFSIIAVEATGNRSGAQEFIRSSGLTYTFVENGRGEQEIVSRLYNVQSFPTTLLLDRHGHVVESYIGFTPGKLRDMETAIQRLLAE